MKKLNLNKKGKYFLYTLLAFVLASCYEQKPIKNYKNAIVHYKNYSIGNGHYFKLEKDGKFLFLHTTKFDYNKYIVGDTVK